MYIVYCHYENLSMQSTEIFFSGAKIESVNEKYMDIFNNSSQTLVVDTRKNRLGEAVSTSAHNRYFGSKIRNIGVSLYIPVLL